MTDLEARLHMLEASVEVQATALTAVHKSQLEAAELVASIQRLGDGASALEATLVQVTEQQLLLLSLGDKLGQVEKESATLTNLADSEQAQQVARRKVAVTLGSVVAAAVVAGAISVAVLFQVQNDRIEDARKSCEARSARDRIIVDVLEGSLLNVPEGPRKQNIESGLVRFRALFVDCVTLDR